MYKSYFGLTEAPFSIVPSSRYLFLSQRHQEAMFHLRAGLGDGGGFAMLTGEVGTGKTTICKALLASLDKKVKAGLILNPTFSDIDLLEAICDEFTIAYQEKASLKQLTKSIYHYLLENHAKGIQTLLVIDESQHLDPQVLEQLRLLTNLETDNQKLLKVLLVGQPELLLKLQTSELRQLSQRITGRYHLLPLSEQDIAQYIQFRLQLAGCTKALFSTKSIRIIAQATHGVPRLINLVCDKALLYTYYNGEQQVSDAIAKSASHDVMSFQAPMGMASHSTKATRFPAMFSALMLAIIFVGAVFKFNQPIKRYVQSQLPPIEVVKTSSDNNTQNHAKLNVTPELKSFVSNSKSLIEATQVLYELWGVDASLLESNCNNDNAPFRCEKKVGTFENVLLENRPVVLTLRLNQEIFYAVLYRISDNTIELINHNQRISLPKNELEPFWQGEYQTLWYSELGSVLKLGNEGESVHKLDLLLADALGEYPIDTMYFDAQLEKRVKAFQLWQGIDADGVVGQNTLRYLDRVTTAFAPTLKHAEVEAM